MYDLHLIVDNFKRLPTDELVSIASAPEKLRLEIIPHLQSELFNRERKDEALLLSEFLMDKPRRYRELAGRGFIRDFQPTNRDRRIFGGH